MAASVPNVGGVTLGVPPEGAQTPPVVGTGPAFTDAAFGWAVLQEPKLLIPTVPPLQAESTEKSTGLGAQT
jgi:hypothetical protein